MILKKDSNIILVKGLSLKEFQCQCKNDSCRAVIIDESLLKAYEKLRKKLGKPLGINSGYRCQLHNASDKVNGRPLSRHLEGKALDISLVGLERFSNVDIEQIAIESGFKYIYFNNEKRFFHVDVDERE